MSTCLLTTGAPKRRFLARTALMALVWLGVNATDGKSWIVGGPAVLTAAWVSVKLLPVRSWRCSLPGAIAFAGFFLRESLRGGWGCSISGEGPRRKRNESRKPKAECKTGNGCPFLRTSDFGLRISLARHAGR